jgi:hypothetical protein
MAGALLCTAQCAELIAPYVLIDQLAAYIGGRIPRFTAMCGRNCLQRSGLVA